AADTRMKPAEVAGAIERLKAEVARRGGGTGAANAVSHVRQGDASALLRDLKARGPAPATAPTPTAREGEPPSHDQWLPANGPGEGEPPAPPAPPARTLGVVEKELKAKGLNPEAVRTLVENLGVGSAAEFDAYAEEHGTYRNAPLKREYARLVAEAEGQKAQAEVAEAQRRQREGRPGQRWAAHPRLE